jgi:hypothetical protein
MNRVRIVADKESPSKDSMALFWSICDIRKRIVKTDASEQSKPPAR